LATGLIKAIPKIVEKVPIIVDNLVNTLLNEGAIQKYIETGIAIITALFENTPLILESVGKAIGSIIDGLVEDFSEYDWVGVGKTIVDKILEGFSELGEAGTKILDLLGFDGSFGIDANYDMTTSGGETGGSGRSGQREPKGGNNVTINNYITGDLDANEQRKNTEQLFAAMAGY
jgi:hypothetical protein